MWKSHRQPIPNIEVVHNLKTKATIKQLSVKSDVGIPKCTFLYLLVEILFALYDEKVYDMASSSIKWPKVTLKC